MKTLVAISVLALMGSAPKKEEKKEGAAPAPVATAAAAMAAEVGKPAPEFTAVTASGEKVSLAAQMGKVVILEWHNKDCPIVKKHYGSGNMQKLQKELTGKGAVWYTVLSSAPGKQGHVDGAQATKDMQERGAAQTATLLDPDGKVGKLYGAKTTPHMYVIDAKGTLVYAGAIDDKPTTDADDIAGAKNYVRAAVEEVLAGRPVSTPSSQPYGCSVKY